MSLNLIQSLQSNLGDATLKKIDPNTQQPVADNADGIEEDKLNQAAIPGVLIILYKYTRTDEGAQDVLHESLTNEWLQEMLGEDADGAIAKVAAYSDSTEVRARERMEMIARQAVGLIRESKPADIKAVKDIMAAERNNILHYLPPALHMGELLHDNTLDDRINKMDGPVSGFMNKIASVFSQSDKNDE